MFSKTGKAGSEVLPRRGRWSIAKRLALLHILAVLVSYLLFGALFYQRRMEQLEEMSSRDLQAEFSSVLAMMREPDALSLLRTELRTQQFEPDRLRPFIRVVNREQQAVLESPWSAGRIPIYAFPPPGKTQRWNHRNGDTYLMGTFRLPNHLFSGPDALLHLAVNTHEAKDLGNQLRLTLVAFIASGTVFAFICGYFIVKLALKPLDDISQTAGNITRRRLDTRIDDSALPVELVSLAHSFNSMLERLEDSFTRLSHYSANLAHELRTPINTMMIESDIALSKERTPEEYRRVIASALEEYGRLSWTIDRLLFLARADLEAHDLDRQSLDLRAEIEDVLDYFFDSACENGVTLEVHGSAVLLVDQTLFRRAVSNLISNAISHTGVAGAVVVTIEQAGTLAARVRIADDGCGIDAEHLPRIFDRFYRVESGGKRQVEGNGLGLAIVKTIMRMHRGTVEIESEPGKGTTVTLDFPALPVLPPHSLGRS
jgi:two-component system, OmpR family, heavy metal sensor histidine kinase CusS